MKTVYAAARIERSITSGSLRPGDRLPSLASLSRRVGASPVTLRKALALLEERGRIEDDGSGFVVSGGTPRTEALVSNRQSSADTVADSLREQILAGSIGHRLPSAKELAVAHRCSHRTIRSACATLVADGVIVRRGSGYVIVPSGRKKSSRAQVYFVGQPALIEGGSVQEFVMGMERELQAQGWGEMRFAMGENPADIQMPDEHLVAAYVHFCSGVRSPWTSFLKQHQRVPSVVLNLHEYPGLAQDSHKNLTWLLPDNRRAGRDIGMHLAAAGHTRCAYLSDITMAEGCALLRLEGLTEAFQRDPSQASRTCRVVDCSSLDNDPDPRTSPLNDDITRVVENALEFSGLSESYIRKEIDGAYGLLHWWNRYTGFRAVFEEVLSDKSVTAWVCSHDALAVLAHTFLAEKSQSCEHGISLASFDNSATAYTLGITSYDFGFGDFGRTAAHCLATPHLLKVDRNNSMHVPGRLVVRGSS